MADQRADDDDRMSSSFRRKLSDGLTGLLDPEGAFGKGRDYVSGFAQGTKSELVRIFASEVRSFLDNMDSVEMLQRVIAGLVIDVKAEIRFSVDKEGKLRAAVTRQDPKAGDAEPAPASPPPTSKARAPATEPE